MGSIEARNGGAARAAALADELRALAPRDPSGRAGAVADLVRAQVADQAGQADRADALARAALPALLAGCPGTTAAAAATAPACDHRAAWHALQILERRARSQRLPLMAEAHVQQALALAEWAADDSRRLASLGSLASLAQERGERETSQRLLAQVRRLAAQRGVPRELARVAGFEAQLAAAQGDLPAALRLYEGALAMAVQAPAQRLEAVLLANISDTCIRLGRPADALRAAERALRIVRRHDDRRSERVLVNNAGIAKIWLGRVAEGKQDLAQLLELWQKSADTGHQIDTLREFGEALAAAGDTRSALDLYHRERALSAELMQSNRRTVQRELQTRFEADARQRDIELAARNNALKTEALANRDLLQHIGWLLAAVMGLAITLAAGLYWRVRDTGRRLEASRQRLQAQSERDPLTDLSNRRHFQAVMAQTCGIDGFEGVLLLVDIDHFKRINDQHGHAVGDQVLLEVARRLNESVRSGDLVVRWGGEEFLILAPHAPPERADQLAARVLQALGEPPLRVGAKTVRLTASIGHARFPLPPFDAEVPWEQAVKLVDLALYTAKHLGRNRGVGITATTAMTLGALRDIEADFEQARRDGRVTLTQTPGPGPQAGMVALAAA